MDTINQNKIAVIIDFDNFNEEKYLSVLFEELKEFGDVIYKGIFYSNLKDNKLNDKSLKHGFTSIIMEPTISSGKNAVDIRIALEIMELLSKDYIDCFCLATNDSDFAPILKKLKEKNKFVIGAGKYSTKDDYKKLCNRFINVDKIDEAQQSDDDTIEKNKLEIKELIKLTDSIIETLPKNSDDSVQFSQVIEALYKRQTDFNPKNYGAKSSKTSVFFGEDLKSHFNLILKGKTYFIKRITVKK